MQHRTISGTIRYLSMKPGREGSTRGRGELPLYPSRRRLGDHERALRKSREPDPTVMRDIICHIGPDRKPRNLLVHLTVGDEFLGSGWMNHDPVKGTVGLAKATARRWAAHSGSGAMRARSTLSVPLSGGGRRASPPG